MTNGPNKSWRVWLGKNRSDFIGLIGVLLGALGLVSGYWFYRAALPIPALNFLDVGRHTEVMNVDAVAAAPIKLVRRDGSVVQKNVYLARVAEAQITLTRACKSIGTHRLTHHDFRHLFATRCLETGIEPNIVADWMGHADGGVLVLQTYGHVRPGQAAAAASTLTF